MTNENRKIVKSRTNSITPIIISCLTCLFLYHIGWLTTAENHLHDNESYLTRAIYESNVIIVEIDQESLKQFSGWPWPRRYYAKVIDNLLQSGSKTIFIDIDFSSTSNTYDDDILATSLKKADKETILMPAFKQYSSTSNNKYLTLSQPNKYFRDHVTAVSVNLIPDSDGLVRNINLHSEFAGESLPTAATIFKNYSAQPGENLKLNFRIMPESFKRISFHEIYNNNFDKELIKGKHIIIGATALELSDQITVPIYKTLAGPIVQAISYQSLTMGKILTLDKTTNSIFLIISCFLLWSLFSVRKWQKGLLRLAVVNISILLISISLHTNNILLLDAIPLLLLATLSYAFTQLSTLDKQLNKIIKQRMVLNKNKELIAHVIKNSSEGLIILTDKLVITEANAAATRIFGDADNILINTPISTLCPNLDISNITDFDNNRFETTSTRKGKLQIHIEISSNRLEINDTCLYTLFLHDISQRKTRHNLLVHKSTHDPLTNLHNRPFLLSSIENAIHAHRTDHQPFTLFMIDLNNFKEINDTLSHNTGDKVLIKLSKHLKTLENDNTFVARLGGDEFSILTSRKFNDLELLSLINKIQTLISKPINLSDITLTIDAAIGVALFPEHATTTDDILIAADVAMYKSKFNQQPYSIYDPQYNYHAKRNLAISNDLKQALNKNQFLLQYQPKVSLKDNMVTSLEALIRWQHPTLGLVPPDEFIPILENSSLIKPVTMFTIETAILKQKELQNHCKNISIAVNISAKLLSDHTLVDDINNLLLLHEVSANNLKLEITESAAMKNNKHTLEVLNRLRDNGLELSIDDFGTSYASFSYLKQLPAMELKIDKLFISNVCNDHSDEIITDSIISLAHGLNMKVVAEGVEDRETYEHLCERGCDIAQGYWISKPLSEENVTSWINNWDKKNRPLSIKENTN